ncbi:MAG: double-cubane-cluster-containing anaerobic reductase [Caldimicrobium sp.]
MQRSASFEVKAYPELWKVLDIDIERLDKMRMVLGEVYEKHFLSQENRPKGMAYFDWVISEINGGRIKEILEAKREGRVVVGTFCIYIPEEIILALDGICIGLCGGSPGTIPDAEKILPRNICPMVKSAFGFKIAKVCLYFQSVDFVYGETTCDAKKKTWEILNEYISTYVMEIPQMKREHDKRLWLEEVKLFIEKMESLSKKKLTLERLLEGIKIMNAKRKALQRLNNLRSFNPAPISGKDCLLIEQIAFYDDPIRFTKKVNELCDELEEKVKRGEGVKDPQALRIMVSGTPMALPNWKLHNIVESLGGVVVNEESCIGTRYFKDLMPEDFSDLESALKALVDRYMKIDCSCFTPNDERVEQVLKEYRDSKAEGIIYYSLAFCHTYNIEAYKIQKACEKEGIPFLFIETDYSPEDIGQIQTRIEAFFETIRERRR